MGWGLSCDPRVGRLCAIGLRWHLYLRQFPAKLQIDAVELDHQPCAGDFVCIEPVAAPGRRRFDLALAQQSAVTALSTATTVLAPCCSRQPPASCPASGTPRPGCGSCTPCTTPTRIWTPPPRTAITRWVQQYDAELAGEKTTGPGLTPEQVEIRKLERENHQLRQDVELLKKASAFFAQAMR